ncbi:MAG: type II toxin-antitoxin system VapC family toxin [Burkholderiaceae bacterium]
MNVLLDTHAFLWWIADDTRLSKHARTLIGDSGTSARFSVVSAWEIAIKVSLGRLRTPADLAAFLLEQIAMNRFEVLQIGLSHALAVHRLPHHHRDPFDRMLAAQAKIERLPLVSGDGRFDAYDIERIW